MMGISRDHKTPYKNLKTCHECGEKFKRGESKVTLSIYDDPWADSPCTVRLHADNDDGHGTCLEKMTDTSWADFRYFDCNKCGRTVVRQCLDNGWRSYVKIMDDEEVCVRCYQDELLENGISVESLESGRIAGDFFNGDELSIHNWKIFHNINGKRIASSADAQNLCKKALELIAAGNKVLIDYDRMAYGGSEGYVTLYTKSMGVNVDG